MPRLLDVRRLGVVFYDDALEMQRDLVTQRQAGRVSDLLLLLEHPAVITLGVGARRSRANLLVDEVELSRRGIALREVARGGNVTYHGPGQLVGYPILSLKPDRCDVRRYVRDLEEVLLATVRVFGVDAGRVDGLSGIWVGTRKLAAIGVRLSRWVTSHGFALNVTTDLRPFQLMHPCGIRDRGVTTLAAESGGAVTVAEVEPVLIREFAAVFGRRLPSGIKPGSPVFKQADTGRRDDAETPRRPKPDPTFAGR